MNGIIVLQARTSSTRLPAKVLLPINSIPLVVLAAKRAANTGREVIVVTSSESSDDPLTFILSQYAIKYYRGSLNNVLERTVAALQNYENDQIIFRLTADNILPDGHLIDEIEADFVARNVNYLCCNGHESGLPYGVSVEVTYLKHLREALLQSVDNFEREHVTPFIRKKFGTVFFNRYKYLNLGHYRCTIDCYDDYLNAQCIFHPINDPINTKWLDILSNKDLAHYKPLHTSAINRLVLGTAQLGLNYGIANSSGMPSLKESEKIIKTAISCGVEFIDTANAYGISESVIGESLSSGWDGRCKIITKLSPLNECVEDESKRTIHALVTTSIYKSLTNLRMQKIDVLLLHRFKHLNGWNGAIWEKLKELKSQGIIGQLGISIQTPQELQSSLSIPEISFIQMPYNIMDHRWDALIPKICHEKKNRNITVHVRSALLQGLFVNHDPIVWKKAHITNGKEIIRWLDEACQIYNKQSVADLCISYVNSNEWIDGIVIGMENMNQLHNNLSFFCSPKFNEKELGHIRANRPRLSTKSLDPSLWNIYE